MFKVIFDAGRPYEVLFNSEEALKDGLKRFYEENNEPDGYPFDAKVFNSENEDISESQFIEEIIGEITGEGKYDN